MVLLNINHTNRALKNISVEDSTACTQNSQDNKKNQRIATVSGVRGL